VAVGTHVDPNGPGTLSAEQVLKGLTRQRNVTLQDIARKIADVEKLEVLPQRKGGLAFHLQDE
jgi:hypothetical protein